MQRSLGIWWAGEISKTRAKQSNVWMSQLECLNLKLQMEHRVNFNGCKCFLKERVATKYQYLCMGFESNDGSVIKDQKQPHFKPLLHYCLLHLNLWLGLTFDSVLSGLRLNINPSLHLYSLHLIPLFQGAKTETSFYNRRATQNE